MGKDVITADTKFYVLSADTLLMPTVKGDITVRYDITSYGVVIPTGKTAILLSATCNGYSLPISSFPTSGVPEWFCNLLSGRYLNPRIYTDDTLNTYGGKPLQAVIAVI